MVVLSYSIRKKKRETYVLDLIWFMVFQSKKCLFCGNSLFLVILEYELKNLERKYLKHLNHQNHQNHQNWKKIKNENLNHQEYLNHQNWKKIKNENLNHQEIFVYQSDHANIAFTVPFCNGCFQQKITKFQNVVSEHPCKVQT